MVGKANLPQGFEKKPKVKGSSENAPGWDALDQERAASMADEGGEAAVETHRQKGKSFFTAPPHSSWNGEIAFIVFVLALVSMTKIYVASRRKLI